MGKALAALEARRLVDRHRDPVDRGRIILSVSPAPLEILQSL